MRGACVREGLETGLVRRNKRGSERYVGLIPTCQAQMGEEEVEMKPVCRASLSWLLRKSAFILPIPKMKRESALSKNSK
jgi:hypothetical protein